jgi:CHASE2 domain-containing sensor protein
MRNRRKHPAADKKKKSKQRRKSFWRRLLRATPIIVASIFLTLIYGNTPVFRKLENLVSDSMMRIREPQGTSNIVIVRITDDYYKKEFGGKSPLDPEKLNQIIGAIAAGRPKVIGVALDTSSETFKSLSRTPDWPPIIWARDATYSSVHGKYLLSGVLGIDSPSVSYGLVVLKLDSDAVIRRYSRWYDTDAGPVPSLPWAMLKKFRNDERQLSAAPDFKDEFLINYVGPANSPYFTHVPVEHLDKMRKQGIGESSIFENRMVILSGDYGAQDEHNTPVGRMIGAEVLASIAETEQQGGGRKPAGKVAIALLAIFDSIVLLSLIHVFGLGKTLLMSVVLVPVLALLFSVVLFGSLYYAGTLAVVLIAVLSYEVYETGKVYFKKWREQAADELK